jgi:hypothetical protein
MGTETTRAASPRVAPVARRPVGTVILDDGPRRQPFLVVTL